MLSHFVFFAFNRPNMLQLTLTSLAGNLLVIKSSLTIFAMVSVMKKTNRVRALFKNFSKKFRGRLSVDVVERPRSMGCAASVIDGLTQMFRLHERLIVIEDDIFTSPHTQHVLNEGLARYADHAKIFNIAAWTPPHIARKLPADYPYDVYAISRFNCWGWTSRRGRFQDISNLRALTSALQSI